MYTKEVDALAADSAAESGEADDPDAEYKAAEKQSYSELFSFIRN